MTGDCTMPVAGWPVGGPYNRKTGLTIVGGEKGAKAPTAGGLSTAGKDPSTPGTAMTAWKPIQRKIPRMIMNINCLIMIDHLKFGDD